MLDYARKFLILSRFKLIADFSQWQGVFKIIEVERLDVLDETFLLGIVVESFVVGDFGQTFSAVLVDVA